MIPLSEINSTAKQYSVPAETIEKDYMICWLLTCFSHSQLADSFSFHGGTAIKRVYFEDHRFSEDVDLLTAKKLKPEKIIDALKQSFNLAAKEANIHFGFAEGDKIYKDSRLQIPVTYSGYDEIIGSPKEIKLDFEMDRQAFGASELKPIIESYSDLNNHCHSFAIHSINTILANKIGMLVDSTRNEPRDLYDIWFFLKHRTQFMLDIDLMKATIKEKYAFVPSFGTLRSHLKSDSYKSMWNIRLQKQMGNLPEVGLVLEEVEKALEQLF